MSAPPQRAVDVALGLVGLTAPDPNLGQLVDPGGSLAHRVAVEEESLCVLSRLGFEERVWRVPPRAAPYVNGTAPALVEARAGGSPMRPRGACRAAPQDAPPGFGDGVWYERAGGSPEHVDLCVVDVEPGADEEELLLVAVAGGQRVDAGDVASGRAEAAQVGRQTVKRVQRTLRWRGDAWYCQATGRRVWAVLGFAEMCELYPLLP